MLALTAPTAAQSETWTYREVPHGDFKTVEAFIPSRDHRAILAVNCSFAREATLSIQYRPAATVGIAMAPVLLNSLPSGDVPLGSKLIWEPDRLGAYARDGSDDRNASEVAEAIEAAPSTLTIVAADFDGEPVETIYQSDGNLDAVKRVVTQCPWNPSKANSQ
jgi:hypothetical protein